jgi:hypothetical protein
VTPPAPRKRRGCLRGCLPGLLGLALLAALGFAALQALLAPWNFFLGGHFHWWPGWTGAGAMHTRRSGGDYTLWLTLEPTIPGYRKSPMRGTAWLCTPVGERIQLLVHGDMPRRHGRDLTGVPLHFSMDHYFGAARFSGDTRPDIALWGAFGDRVLTLDDSGSIAQAFNPDGTVRAKGQRGAERQENVHLVLREAGSWRLGRPTCPRRVGVAPGATMR